MKKTIEIKNLSKIFGEDKVLDNINLICNKGEITGIIGKNGSGKSVLLKCICGILKESNGEIFICGEKNVDYIKHTHKVGAIIEAPAFLENYNGIKNLELLYDILNKSNRGYLKKIMKKVGLEPESKKLVSKYSVGMKQRLAIAQAIMEDQDILILDEPMTGLDAEGAESIRELFLELKEKNKTILITTHNEEDVNRLCDYVYVMKQGKMYNRDTQEKWC